MPRRKNDYYPTPTGLTLALLDTIPSIKGKVVYEPCSGKNEIAKPLWGMGCTVYTNDIDPEMPSQFHTDAAKDEIPDMERDVDWVITNPPFSHAYEIFHNLAEKGEKLQKVVGVALLLRLSFLEPVQKRKRLLCNAPPDQLIVLPRTSFTGDGKTDSVTCAWMVWSPNELNPDEPRIKVYGREDLEELERGEG